MNRIISVVAAVSLLSGCMVNGRVFNPIAMVQEDQEKKERAEQEKVDAQKREEAEAKYQAERAASEAKSKAENDERQAKYKAEQEAAEKARAVAAAAEKERKAALEAKAKNKATVKLTELGVALLAPGDVEVKKHDSDAYGTPALFVSGEASGFEVIVANAADDRYDLEQRIRRERAEYHWGMDVIRQKELKGGGWEFEFSYPEYYTDGRSAGSRMGYFSRQVVGGKKYNCFISAVNEAHLNDAAKACTSITAAK